MSRVPQQTLQQSAFGELITVEPTPIVQIQFTYGNNLLQVIPLPINGASISNTDSHAEVSTAAAVDNNAHILTRKFVRYNNGQGNKIEFTAIFSTGVAGSEQIIGLGNCCDGLMFGYNGADFGVLRRRGGEPEVRRLTITTASTTAENITITLDGQAESVAVTNSGDVATTAREIASAIYLSTTTYGWGAASSGADVIFVALDSGPHTGTYSLTGATTAVGTFAQDIAGVAAVDSWTSQTAWSVDNMDGSGPSKMTLDPTKGNVYKISYQWLGYGQISFFIEDQFTGDFQLVHTIEYTNQFTETSIKNPSAPIIVNAKNTTNNTVVTVRTPSIAGFVEGKDLKAGPRFSTESVKSFSGTTEVPMLILRNKLVFSGIFNRIELEPITASIGAAPNSVNTTTIFRFYIDATAEGGTSYQDVDTSNSSAEFDVASSSFFNGSLFLTEIISGNNSRSIDLEKLSVGLFPSSTLLITAEFSKSSVSNEASVTVNHKELV
jgi:hypothetical protein